MYTLYTWFYCLPIWNILCLLLILSALSLCLRRRLEKRRFWRPAIALLLLTWLAVIVSATLAGRSGIFFRPAPELIPFHSYRAVMAGENPELLRSNFMIKLSRLSGGVNATKPETYIKRGIWNDPISLLIRLPLVAPENVYKWPITTKIIAKPFIQSKYNILCFIILNPLSPCTGFLQPRNRQEYSLSFTLTDRAIDQQLYSISFLQTLYIHTLSQSLPSMSQQT